MKKNMNTGSYVTVGGAHLEQALALLDETAGLGDPLPEWYIELRFALMKPSVSRPRSEDRTADRVGAQRRRASDRLYHAARSEPSLSPVLRAAVEAYAPYVNGRLIDVRTIGKE